MKSALLILLVACNAPQVKRLPSATTTPTTRIARTTQACGFTVAYEGQSYARYHYTYDDFGRVASVLGHFTAGGPDDRIDYAYDHLDHLTHATEAATAANRAEQTYSYDTLGDLIEYTELQQADTTRYTYADLTATGQPKTEMLVYDNGAPQRYLLAYDATDRLVAATLAGGETTTYTYDDDQARTLTVDTANGAFHGVILYDDQNRELSEIWGGTDPAATARSTTYDYVDDLLAIVTYQQAASDANPFATLEVDTLLYTCDTP